MSRPLWLLALGLYRHFFGVETLSGKPFTPYLLEMIVTTEAIVLRARKQGETSKIVTLYTREFGKLNAIAKGARELKSKFGASLEMFTFASVVIYKREKQDALNLLSKADTISGNRGISQSLKKMEAATAILELLLQAMHDEEANGELFSSLSETLQRISTSEESHAPVLTYRFYLAFAREMGFALDLTEETPLPQNFANVLSRIEAGNLGGYTEEDLRNLHGFFNAYFAEHVPGITSRSMKSSRVFDRL